jgi:hypothetical protein
MCTGLQQRSGRARRPGRQAGTGSGSGELPRRRGAAGHHRGVSVPASKQRRPPTFRLVKLGLGQTYPTLRYQALPFDAERTNRSDGRPSAVEDGYVRGSRPPACEVVRCMRIEQHILCLKALRACQQGGTRSQSGNMNYNT